MTRQKLMSGHRFESPYEGREVTGAPDTVLSRGKVIVEGGKFVGRAGAGTFLKPNPRS
ncbi:MAG: hypothetical protein ACRD3M_07205 [Thermoanaerobaculia bacterium]